MRKSRISCPIILTLGCEVGRRRHLLLAPLLATSPGSQPWGAPPQLGPVSGDNAPGNSSHRAAGGQREGKHSIIFGWVPSHQPRRQFGSELGEHTHAQGLDPDFRLGDFQGPLPTRPVRDTCRLQAHTKSVDNQSPNGNRSLTTDWYVRSICTQSMFPSQRPAQQQQQQQRPISSERLEAPVGCWRMDVSPFSVRVNIILPCFHQFRPDFEIPSGGSIHCRHACCCCKV